MPSNNYCPRFCLSSQVDMRPWLGSNPNLFDRDVVEVEYPATGIPVHDDILSFLNGRGSELTLAEEIQIVSDGLAFTVTWYVGIDENDKVYVEVNSNTFVFSLEDSEGWFPLGWGDVGDLPATSVLVNGRQRVTAPNDWTRGDLETTEYFLKRGVTDIQLYMGARVQDVPTLLRKWDQGDADDTSQGFSLQHIDAVATGNNDTNRIRWGVNSKGHVFCSYITALVDDPSFFYDFKDRLGFTGSEAYVAEPYGLGFVTLTATYPCPGVFCPSRPYDTIEPIVEDISNTVTLTDGSLAANYVASHYRWYVRAYIDGPADAVNSTTIDDLHKHWQARCRPLLHNGAKCALYQEWGDSRRASERSNYSILYTKEMDGYRGRLIGWVAEGNAKETRISWPNNELRRRAPWEFFIQTQGGEYALL